MANPDPDRTKSAGRSNRPIFKTVIPQWKRRGKRFWLPDASLAGPGQTECNLLSEDGLSSSSIPGLKIIPKDIPDQSPSACIHTHAREVAHNIFYNYSLLLKYHIYLYNKYREQLEPTSTASDCHSPGRYIRVCRLLSEQILRPHFPFIPDFPWGTFDPILPIFEMAHKPIFSKDPAWKIISYKLSGVVEVRQRQYKAGPIQTEDTGWSSSSSSSSVSSIGNIVIDN